MIVSFQYNQLSELARRVIENIKYTDANILLDTGSTFLVLKNRKMLLNTRDSDKILRAYTNGGHQDSKIVRYFLEFFKVWLNENSMANIYNSTIYVKDFASLWKTM